MAASKALASVAEIEAFIYEYFDAWGGTDEKRILSYYAENVTVQIPGTLMQGKAALRGGSGNSDTGISGFLAGHDRREVHAKAET